MSPLEEESAPIRDYKLIWTKKNKRVTPMDLII